MRTISPFAFFRVVLRPARTFAVTAVAVLGCAAWMARTDPADIDQVLSFALLCQMFAAATGYGERARRGHFDPVLVCGNPRRLVALAHCLVSVCPGLVVWALLAAVEWSVHPAAWPLALTAPGLAALLWVSAVAWTVALPLTRYASGLIWLALLFVIVAASWAEPLREPFQATSHAWTSALTLAGAALVNPFLLLARAEAVTLASSLTIAVAAAFVTMLGAAFVVGLDSPLRSSP